MRVKSLSNLSVVIFATSLAVSTAEAQDPLPSWNEGATKTAIVDFVTAVTDESNKDFGCSVFHATSL